MKTLIPIIQEDGKTVFAELDLSKKEIMEIAQEQVRTAGLREFAEQKHQEDQEFIKRLLCVEPCVNCKNDPARVLSWFFKISPLRGLGGGFN